MKNRCCHQMKNRCCHQMKNRCCHQKKKSCFHQMKKNCLQKKIRQRFRYLQYCLDFLGPYFLHHFHYFQSNHFGSPYFHYCSRHLKKRRFHPKKKNYHQKKKNYHQKKKNYHPKRSYRQRKNRQHFRLCWYCLDFPGQCFLHHFHCCRCRRCYYLRNYLMSSCLLPKLNELGAKQKRDL